MYLKSYNRENFSYRKLLLELIVIVVIVALLVCLISSAIRKNNKIEVDGGYNETFSKNLDKMKEKTLEYFNESNIPKEVGESKKIILEEMISNKIVTPIKDEGQKLCNSKKSYIKLTKKEKEYQLKVNLNCSGKEDYITLHLNHHSYCNNTYLCENEIDNNQIKKEDNIKEEINNKKRNISSKTSNIKQNTKVKITTTKKRKTPITPVTNKGTIVITSNSTNYLYEYSKTTHAKLSNWSKWSDWQTVNCNTKEIICSSNDVSCLKELQRYDRKEKLNTYSKNYNTVKSSLKNTNTLYNIYMCSNYNYIKIDNLIYRLNSIEDYKLINNINANTKKTTGGWRYDGRTSYITPPRDTYNTHYVLINADYSNCNNTCSNLPKYIYDKYTYINELLKVTSYTCNTNKSNQVPVYTRYDEAVSFTRNENQYGTVCYKSERTRLLINRGNTTIKWSKYNDRALLNHGFKYTGNRKKK